VNGRQSSEEPSARVVRSSTTGRELQWIAPTMSNAFGPRTLYVEDEAMVLEVRAIALEESGLSQLWRGRGPSDQRS